MPLRDDRRGRRATVGSGTTPLRAAFVTTNPTAVVAPIETATGADADEERHESELAIPRDATAVAASASAARERGGSTAEASSDRPPSASASPDANQRRSLVEPSAVLMALARPFVALRSACMRLVNLSLAPNDVEGSVDAAATLDSTTSTICERSFANEVASLLQLPVYHEVRLEQPPPIDRAFAELSATVAPPDERSIDPLPLDERSGHALPPNERSAQTVPPKERSANAVAFDKRSTNVSPPDELSANAVPLDERSTNVSLPDELSANAVPLDERSAHAAPLDERSVLKLTLEGNERAAAPISLKAYADDGLSLESDVSASESQRQNIVVVPVPARPERVVPITRLPLRPQGLAITWTADVPGFAPSGTRSRAERHALLERLVRDSTSVPSEAIARAYREEDGEGRALALRALLRNDPQAGRSAFIEALRVGSDDERALAVDGLAAIGARDALAPAFADRVDAIAAKAALAYVGTLARADYRVQLAPFIDEKQIDTILALLAGIVE